MRYRVWCLSWGETEAEGMDVVGYDPCSDEEPQDCIAVAYYNLDSASEAVHEYADWAWRHRDGYESSWPLMFRVKEGDLCGDFSVSVEMRPRFRVAPVKAGSQ